MSTCISSASRKRMAWAFAHVQQCASISRLSKPLSISSTATKGSVVKLHHALQKSFRCPVLHPRMHHCRSFSSVSSKEFHAQSGPSDVDSATSCSSQTAASTSSQHQEKLSQQLPSADGAQEEALPVPHSASKWDTPMFTTPGNMLIDVAVSGDVEQLRSLLCIKGFSPNIHSLHSGTGLDALQSASFANAPLEVIDILIQEGADIFRAHPERGTCLNIAAREGNFNIAKHLLALGAEPLVNQTALVGPSQCPVLFDAIHSGDVETCKLFLHTIPGLRCLDGYPPLQHAIRLAKIPVINLLLDTGLCEIADCVGPDGLQPWMAASLTGNPKVLETVLDWTPGGWKEAATHVNARLSSNRSLLMMASSRGETGIAHSLIKLGANVNLVDSFGETSLSLALRNGFWRVAMLLVDAGADVHHVTQQSFTILHVASKYCDAQIVKKLITYGSDVHSTTDDGETALHLASHAGKAAVVDCLLSAGAEVDKPRGDGCTALFLTGSTEVAKKLVSRGANLHKGMPDASSLHSFARQGVVGLSNHLLENTPFQVIERRGHALLKRKADKDAKKKKKKADSQLAINQDDGTMPLFAKTRISLAQLKEDSSVDEGKEEMQLEIRQMQLQLLEFVDEKKRTPFMTAIEHENLQVAEELLAAGASPSASGIFGLNSLHWAADNNKLDVAKFLLDRGVSVHQTTQDGLTPLWFAATKNKSEQMTELLTSHGCYEQIDRKKNKQFMMVFKSEKQRQSRKDPDSIDEFGDAQLQRGKWARLREQKLLQEKVDAEKKASKFDSELERTRKKTRMQ